MIIYLIRHGETDANKNGRIQGRINTPLNSAGVKLADLTGKAMKEEKIKFDVCFSSPLKRAFDTANIILSESGNDVPVIIDERLIEFSMGIYENYSFIDGKPEIVKLLREYLSNPTDLPAFPEGESIKDIKRRTQDFLFELSKKNYNSVLVSSHGCAVRAMLNYFYEDKHDFWQGRVPYNCSVNIISVDNGTMTLKEKDKIYYDSSLLRDRYKK